MFWVSRDTRTSTSEKDLSVLRQFQWMHIAAFCSLLSCVQSCYGLESHRAKKEQILGQQVD